MLTNTTTASVISKGLYRYDQFLKDAKDCPHCQQVWTMMKQHDEEQLSRVVEHLKQHFDREGKTAAAA